MFEPCDCGSGKGYIACCGRLHAGTPAQSAEELMRSRYSAFSRRNVPYLLKTWAAETRPLVLDLDPEQDWTGLRIEHHERPARTPRSSGSPPRGGKARRPAW